MNRLKAMAICVVLIVLKADATKLKTLQQRLSKTLIIGSFVLTSFTPSLVAASVPCPGKYCPNPAKFQIVHSLGIPFISDRKFDDRKQLLEVDSWNTWNSADNPKYAVHNKKKKIYETNEICYIVCSFIYTNSLFLIPIFTFAHD